MRHAHFVVHHYYLAGVIAIFSKIYEIKNRYAIRLEHRLYSIFSKIYEIKKGEDLHGTSIVQRRDYR